MESDGETWNEQRGSEIGDRREAENLAARVAELGGQPPAALRPGVYAPWSDEPGFDAGVRRLRAAGERVVYGLPGQSGDAGDMQCDQVLEPGPSGWCLRPVGS